MKIVIVGHVCIDHNISEHSIYTNWGSPLMYMAHYFHKYNNIEPSLIAPSGKDFDKYAKQVLLMPTSNEPHTLLYKNHTYQDGHRTQRCEYFEQAVPVPLTKSIQNEIVSADIICLAPLLANHTKDYITKLMSYRKKSSLAVLHGQGFFRSVSLGGRVSQKDFNDAEEIISLFDLVIFSEDDHSAAGELTKRWGQIREGCYPIMTQGAQGASWADSKGKLHSVKTVAVPEAEIVDSVGCGDVFIAATMYKYFYDRDITTAIKAGNEAARAKLFSVGL